jgi:hypothetical protein
LLFVSKRAVMQARMMRIFRRVAVVVAISLTTLLAIRAYDSQRGPPLEPWHTYVPHELGVSAIDKADWNAYLKAEDAIFDAVRTEVMQNLPPRGSPSHQPLFRGQPGLSGTLRAGLEPFFGAETRR